LSNAPRETKTVTWKFRKKGLRDGGAIMVLKGWCKSQLKNGRGDSPASKKKKE